MNAINPDTKPSDLAGYALVLIRPFGGVAILFGLISLAGYWASFEDLYRPIPNGPATNPLTAVCIVLIGLSLFHNETSSWGDQLQKLFSILAIGVTSLRLMDAYWGSNFSHLWTPFHGLVSLELQAGKDNGMGTNSAMMLLGVSLAILLKQLGKHWASQIIASMAVAVPMVSFLGYAYGLNQFYGQMSMLTATAGFTIAIASLALTSNHALLRGVLSPYIGGRVARYQIIVGYLVPSLLGYLLLKTIANTEGSMIGAFVISICWFIVIMVGVSAMAIEKVDQMLCVEQEKLERLAMTDPLTGLPSRRRFFEFGEYEISKAKRSGSRLWVLMLDIDNFKKINDAAGHAVGDQALVDVAKSIKKSLRDSDIVGRIGGEEFAVVLPDSTRASSEVIAERIRTNVANTPIAGWSEHHGPVTVSIGCVEINPLATLDVAMQNADVALYKSKGGGRNRVTFHS